MENKFKIRSTTRQKLRPLYLVYDTIDTPLRPFFNKPIVPSTVLEEPMENKFKIRSIVGINNFRLFGPPKSTLISPTQIGSKITQIDTFFDSKLPIFRVKLPISGNVHIFLGIFFGFDPATLRSATFGYFFGYFCPKAPKSTVELSEKKVPKSTLFSTLEFYSSLQTNNGRYAGGKWII